MLCTKRGEGPKRLGTGSVHQFIRKILWPDSQWCKAVWTVTHQPPPFDPKDYAKCKVARLLAPPGQDHSHQENPKFVVFQKYEWGTQAFSDAPTMISKEQKNRIPQRFGIQILYVCALFESGPHQSIVPYQYTISFFLKKNLLWCQCRSTAPAHQTSWGNRLIDGCMDVFCEDFDVDI